jgi:hypothetical protein
MKTNRSTATSPHLKPKFKFPSVKVIVMAILGYLVFKYELYTYSLSQWEELALASLLVFRDTGFVVVGSVLGLMAVVHVSSAIYRRRQRYVVG